MGANDDLEPGGLRVGAFRTRHPDQCRFSDGASTLAKDLWIVPSRMIAVHSPNPCPSPAHGMAVTTP